MPPSSAACPFFRMPPYGQQLTDARRCHTTGLPLDKKKYILPGYIMLSLLNFRDFQNVSFFTVLLTL